MRTFIVFALFAFLAIGFVQARPAEEESQANAENNVEDNAEETSEADETTAEEGEADADDDADEDEEEESTSTTTTTEAAPKHKKIFWPRFGGHGPVVIHPRLKIAA